MPSLGLWNCAPKKTKDTHAEADNDDEDDARATSSRMQSEFIGGEHDPYEDVVIDDEDLGQRAYHQLAKMTLDAATNLLRRDDEVAAAKKAGGIGRQTCK